MSDVLMLEWPCKVAPASALTLPERGHIIQRLRRNDLLREAA